MGPDKDLTHQEAGKGPAVTRQGNARKKIESGSGEGTEPQPYRSRKMDLQAIIKELQNRIAHIEAEIETERLLKALKPGLLARLAAIFGRR